MEKLSNDKQAHIVQNFCDAYESGKENAREINVPISFTVPIYMSDNAFERIKASLEERYIAERDDDIIGPDNSIYPMEEYYPLEHHALFHIAELVKKEVNSLVDRSWDFVAEDVDIDDNFGNFMEHYVERVYSPWSGSRFDKELDDYWVDWACPVYPRSIR